MKRAPGPPDSRAADKRRAGDSIGATDAVAGGDADDGLVGSIMLTLRSEMDGSLHHISLKAAQVHSSTLADLIGTAQDAGRVPADVDPVSAALRLTSMVDGLGSHVIVGSVSRAEARRTLDIAMQEMLHLPDRSGA